MPRFPIVRDHQPDKSPAQVPMEEKGNHHQPNAHVANDKTHLKAEDKLYLFGSMKLGKTTHLFIGDCYTKKGKGFRIKWYFQGEKVIAGGGRICEKLQQQAAEQVAIAQTLLPN